METAITSFPAQKIKEVYVRLPAAGEIGAIDKMHRDMWMAFFFQFGFRRLYPTVKDFKDDLILEFKI